MTPQFMLKLPNSGQAVSRGEKASAKAQRRMWKIVIVFGGDTTLMSKLPVGDAALGPNHATVMTGPLPLHDSVRCVANCHATVTFD
jgi:hypothetical protein